MVLTFSMLICTCKKKYIVVQSTNIWDIIDIRPVVPGSAGGAMVPPDFGRSVNPKRCGLFGQLRRQGGTVLRFEVKVAV